jgi:hypothetical protein
MTIDILIDKLMKLQKLYPGAMVYFTDEINKETWETYLEDFYVDEESDEIEVKFTTNERDGM